ncbi:unnamed protein product [Medioppia subpectinata]|uniref:Uncharacterized protein n=1 Tax=Medioppia subpectinata TaxID=1979941 RepID=A0A7R9LFJ3_9ACAR|nr:unnamed protein product [Medioppia subpectinata]CAG2117878.1 unnamed protein product [Medioppia subpectinata]
MTDSSKLLPSSSSGANQRPNSSRFPPLVSTLPVPNGQSVRRIRSASFDNSFTTFDVNRDKHYDKNNHRVRNRSGKHLSLDLDQQLDSSEVLQTLTDITISGETNAKPEYSVTQEYSVHNNNKLNANYDNMYSKQDIAEDELEALVDYDDPYPSTQTLGDEFVKLKSENRVLKQNFIQMTKMLQKHSRLMARKDEIILKLQDQFASNLGPNNNGINYNLESSGETQVVVKDIDVFVEQNLRQFYHKSQELVSKTANYSHFADTMATEFGRQVTECRRFVDEINRYHKTNGEILEKKVQQTQRESQERHQNLSAEYSALQNTCDILVQQNIALKSLIDHIHDLCNIDTTYDVNKPDSINSLKQFLGNLFARQRRTSTEADELRRRLSTEEDCLLDLTELLAECELELELLGRTPDTIQRIVEKFTERFDAVYNRRQTQYSAYFDSLKRAWFDDPDADRFK